MKCHGHWQLESPGPAALRLLSRPGRHESRFCNLQADGLFLSNQHSDIDDMHSIFMSFLCGIVLRYAHSNPDTARFTVLRVECGLQGGVEAVLQPDEKDKP